MRQSSSSVTFLLLCLGLFISLITFQCAGAAAHVPISNPGLLEGNKTDGRYPAIMLTGYWHPTGQMIARFSTDTVLNPAGWQGENWEGRGYSIYSYFPDPATYTGTFAVDYQKTWEDFWAITTQIKPVAIISFGAGDGPWEIEWNARNLSQWVFDSVAPILPTPNPPDDTVPVGYIRHPSLPVQAIADAVEAHTTINAWVDWQGNPGAFLCEYIAYLGMWYQAIHAADSQQPCDAAGFIHVNQNVPLIEAQEAVNITLRETITSLVGIDRQRKLRQCIMLLQILSGGFPAEPILQQDINNDDKIGLAEVFYILHSLSQE